MVGREAVKKCLFFDVAECVLKLAWCADDLVIKIILPIERREFMASLIVFSLKTTAIEFDVGRQFKFPILAVRQIETKDEIDVDGTDALDVVHDFGNIEFPSWLQREVGRG